MSRPAAVPALPTMARRGRPRKTAAQRDEGNRRHELVRAAARLFCAQGFDATSTRDIAAAADMQSGSPFYYFESKTALLHAVMKDGMARATISQQRALRALGARANAQDKLRVLIRHHFEILLGEDSDFITVMLYEWRSLSLAQRQEITEQKDAYGAVWTPALRALHRTGRLKARPEMARQLIFGALHWSVQWYRPDGPMTLDEITREAMGLFTGQA